MLFRSSPRRCASAMSFTACTIPIADLPAATILSRAASHAGPRLRNSASRSKRWRFAFRRILPPSFFRPTHTCPTPSANVRVSGDIPRRPCVLNSPNDCITSSSHGRNHSPCLKRVRRSDLHQCPANGLGGRRCIISQQTRRRSRRDSPPCCRSSCSTSACRLRSG